MGTDVIRYPLFTWEETLHESCLHLQATRAQKTQRYYEVQLGGLVRWAAQEQEAKLAWLFNLRSLSF